MSQAQALIQGLKRQLKAHGKTYKDVAVALDLSEASVKRLFSDGNISLNRLEQICDAIEIPLTELVLSSHLPNQHISALTVDQEKQIANDVLLLLITVCVINGYGFNEILSQYEIAETELISKLAKLDRLNIIELLPGNRVKLKISANFTWLPNGPIQQFFQQRVKEEFFRCRFDKPTEKLVVINGLLSLGSNAEIQKRFTKLASEFVDLKNDDTTLAMNEKHGTTMVLAVRQWHSSLFEEIKKK